MTMSLDEGVSRFIGRLYESAYDADAWRASIHELMDRTGARLVFVSCADVRHREYSRAEFYGPENSAFVVGNEEYMEEMYRTDPSLLWASSHPDAGVCDTARIMARDDFRRLPYVTWQRSRFGTEHWRVLFTKPVDDLSFALSLHPPAGDGPASKEQCKLHKLLFEHMERALRLAARPPDLGGETGAVMILDTSGHVLSMSPRAEQLVCMGDGLRLERRRLIAGSLEATDRLDHAILSAVESGSFGGAGGGVRLARAAGSDWMALVSPCPRFLEHLPVRRPAAVLRVVEAKQQAALTPGQAELFDLSPREIEVAQALLGGHSLESICALLAISRNTVKAHVQSIFRKTGTNRQSELVHLLCNVTRT
jgi:DNA-binding CsgD family transcriptional regulator